MHDLVQTLSKQNQEIIAELDTHVHAHEEVRSKLDRREEVASLMDTFNRDLMGSKLSLERDRAHSPYSGHSPLRQSANSTQYRQY